MLAPPRGYGFILSIAWGLSEERLLTYTVSNFEGQDAESGWISVDAQVAEVLDRIDDLFRRYKVEAAFLEDPSSLTRVKKAVDGLRGIKTAEWQRKIRSVRDALPHVRNVLSNKAELRMIDSTPELYTTCSICGGRLEPAKKHHIPRREPLFPFPVKEVCLTFYRPEEWKKLKQMIPPKKREYKKYREWLKNWRMLVDLLLSDGKDVIVVDTNVDDLMRWCQGRGITYDDPERNAYALEAAKQGKIVKTYYAKNYPNVTPLNEELEELEAKVIEAIRGVEIYNSEWYKTPVTTRDVNYKKLKHTLIMPQLRRIAEALTPLLKEWPPDLVADSLPFTISEKEHATLINLLKRGERKTKLRKETRT